jgi:hypothetical protein
VQRGAGSRLGSRIGSPRLYFAGVLSVLGGLLVWELASRFVVANALFLAAPSQIFAAIAALAKSGELWQHMSISAIEFALGYAIASVLGVIIGFAMAESAVMKHVLQPWISGLYATPTIALAPLFILWLGIGIWSKVLVVIFLCAVSGDHQHRGRPAHDKRAADRDAALIRRYATADFLQGVAALGSALYSCRAQAGHRPGADRRRRGGAVRVPRRTGAPDRPIGGCFQYAGSLCRA